MCFVTLLRNITRCHMGSAYLYDI